MKTHYKVTVSESYSKSVDVYVEDESLLENEVALMQENGEIEWDRGEDFDNWEIVNYYKVECAEWEVRRVKKWCIDMVNVTALVDPDWVESEMDEFQCQDWLEQMRDRGIDIPEQATSSDLWDAVQAYRRRDMKYGK